MISGIVHERLPPLEQPRRWVLLQGPDRPQWHLFQSDRPISALAKGPPLGSEPIPEHWPLAGQQIDQINCFVDLRLSRLAASGAPATDCEPPVEASEGFLPRRNARY